MCFVTNLLDKRGETCFLTFNNTEDSKSWCNLLEGEKYIDSSFQYVFNLTTNSIISVQFGLFENF